MFGIFSNKKYLAQIEELENKIKLLEAENKEVKKIIVQDVGERKKLSLKNKKVQDEIEDIKEKEIKLESLLKEYEKETVRSKEEEYQSKSKIEILKLDIEKKTDAIAGFEEIIKSKNDSLIEKEKMILELKESKRKEVLEKEEKEEKIEETKEELKKLKEDKDRVEFELEEIKITLEENKEKQLELEKLLKERIETDSLTKEQEYRYKSKIEVLEKGVETKEEDIINFKKIIKEKEYSLVEKNVEFNSLIKKITEKEKVNLELQILLKKEEFGNKELKHRYENRVNTLTRELEKKKEELKESLITINGYENDAESVKSNGRTDEEFKNLEEVILEISEELEVEKENYEIISERYDGLLKEVEEWQKWDEIYKKELKFLHRDKDILSSEKMLLQDRYDELFDTTQLLLENLDEYEEMEEDLSQASEDIERLEVELEESKEKIKTLEYELERLTDVDYSKKLPQFKDEPDDGDGEFEDAEIDEEEDSEEKPNKSTYNLGNEDYILSEYERQIHICKIEEEISREYENSLDYKLDNSRNFFSEKSLLDEFLIELEDASSDEISDLWWYLKENSSDADYNFEDEDMDKYYMEEYYLRESEKLEFEKEDFLEKNLHLYKEYLELKQNLKNKKINSFKGVSFLEVKIDSDNKPKISKEEKKTSYEKIPENPENRKRIFNNELLINREFTQEQRIRKIRELRNMLNNGFPSSYKIYSSNIEDALFLVNIAYFREDSKGFWSEVYQELGISERGLEYQQEKVRAHLYESFKVTMQKENLYLDESFKDVYNSVMAHTFVPVNKIDDFMLYVNKFYQNNLNEELNFFKAEEELKRILLETKCDFYFLPVGSRKIISSMESLFVQYFLESLEYLDILMTERDDISEVREIRKRAIEKWFKKLKDGFFDVEEEREEREEKEPRVTIKSNYTGKKSKKTKPIFPNEKPEKVNEPTFFFESGKLSLRFPKMDIPSRKNGENIAHPYLMFVNQRIRLEPKFDNIQKIFKLKEESYPLEDANTGMLELKYGLKQKTYESWDFKAIFFKKGKGVSLKARRGDEVYEVEGIGVVNVIYNKEWKLRIDGLKAESFPVDGNDYLVYSQMELNKNIGYLEGRGRVYQIKSKI